jgi:plasmid maintenance system antidote protein VapI
MASLIGISEETIKEMVQEVANLADQFEMKLTGADIY